MIIKNQCSAQNEERLFLTDLVKYLTFSMILSLSGIRGILLNRRNITIMPTLIESMPLAVNLNFPVFSVYSDDMMG